MKRQGRWRLWLPTWTLVLVVGLFQGMVSLAMPPAQSSTTPTPAAHQHDPTPTPAPDGTATPPADMAGMMADMRARMQQMQGMMERMGTDAPDTMHGRMRGMMQRTMQRMLDMMDDMAQMMEMMQQMEGMGMMGRMSGDTGQDHDQHGAPADDAGGEHGGHLQPIPSAGVPDATDARGGQPLAYREEDGAKVFELTARAVRWPILEGVTVTAWTYNGTVPGPLLRVTEGDTVRVILTNDLPEPISVHWHGMPVPNAMDGIIPILPGETFVYEFTAPPAGTFMYHSHIQSDKQVMVGMYAPFIVDPRTPEADPPAVDVMWMLSEWRIGTDGETYPAMPMAGSEPNYFTINGKAFPDTEPIVVRQGQRVRVRLAAIGQLAHPMHLHGMNFRVVAYDGVTLPPAQQMVRNTITVNPGEVVDIEFVADNPGEWMFHCHVLHHVTNDHVEPGGLIGLVRVIE